MERGGEVILPSGGHWRWRDFWLLQLGGGASATASETQ